MLLTTIRNATNNGESYPELQMRKAMTKLVLVFVMITLTSAASAQTDSAAICGIVLTEASHDQGVTQKSRSYLDTIYSSYCSQSGSTKSSSFSGGLSAIIESIPTTLTLGSNNAETALSNFCKNYSSNESSFSSDYQTHSTVVEKALDTFRDCVAIARSGGFASHKLLSDKAAQVNLIAPNGSDEKIKGITTTGDVVCQIGGSSTTSSTKVTFNGTETINCERRAVGRGGNDPRFAALYDEATVAVSTNLGPYSFLWPRSAKLAENEATQIEQELESLRDTVTQTNAAIPVAASKIEIECVTQHQSGSAASCPTSYTVVACASGRAYGSSFTIGEGGVPNGCIQTQGPGTDWVSARCCHAVYRQ